MRRTATFILMLWGCDPTPGSDRADPAPQPSTIDTGPSWADSDCDIVVYQDLDGDGFGNPSVPQTQCKTQEGWVHNDTDCDDTDASLNPETVWFEDVDDDGFGGEDFAVGCEAPDGRSVTDGGDCADDNIDIYPGADEYCDTADNDCDGEIDEGDAVDAVAFYRDNDDDGWGDGSRVETSCWLPDGYTSNPFDCDDTDLEIHPAAPERCDAIDWDCSGRVDNGCHAIDLAKGSALHITTDINYSGFGAAIVSLGGSGGSVGSSYVVSAPSIGLNTIYRWGASQRGEMLAEVDGDPLVDTKRTDLTIGDTMLVASDLDVDGGGELAFRVWAWGTEASELAFADPSGGLVDLDDLGTRLVGSTTTRFGDALLASDMNGDSSSEIVVSAPRTDGTHIWQGAVHVFEGPLTGRAGPESAVGTVEGEERRDAIGSALASWDHDSDGVSELVVGSEGASGQRGVVSLFDAWSGTIVLSDALSSVTGTLLRDGLGGALEATGDLNDDGYPDLAVGTSAAGHYADSAGAIYIFHGPMSGGLSAENADAVVASMEPHTYFAKALASADVDGDGTSDLWALSGASKDAEYSSDGGGARYAMAFYGPIVGFRVAEYPDLNLYRDGMTLDALLPTDLDGAGGADLLLGGSNSGSVVGQLF